MLGEPEGLPLPIVPEAPESLEPITTKQPDEVHNKECAGPSQTPSPSIPGPTEDNVPQSVSVPSRLDALEPIAAKQPDEVHNKECTTQDQAPPSGIAPPALADDVRVPQSASVQSTNSKQDRQLVYATPKQFSDNKSSPYRLEFGDAEQGPKAEEVDPSEIYRTTRSQLRKTGRNVGARRNNARNTKTLKKGYVA